MGKKSDLLPECSTSSLLLGWNRDLEPHTELQVEGQDAALSERGISLASTHWDGAEKKN